MSTAQGNPTTAPQFLRYEHAPALRIAGLRQTQSGDASRTIPLLWARIAAHIDTVAYGLCLSGDESCFDYVAGIAVNKNSSADGTKLPADWVTVELDAQRYAVFAHAGHVSELHQAVGAIFSQWLPQSGQRTVEATPGALLLFERYGENFNPQTGRGDIEIWLPLQP